MMKLLRLWLFALFVTLVVIPTPAHSSPWKFIPRGAVSPPPTYASVDYAIGDIAGGYPVVVTGTNLSTATAVSFGGTAGTITSQTATTINVTVPAHAANVVDIVVTGPGGSATGVNAFEFYTPDSLLTGRWTGATYSAGSWAPRVDPCSGNGTLTSPSVPEQPGTTNAPNGATVVTCSSASSQSVASNISCPLSSVFSAGQGWGWAVWRAASFPTNNTTYTYDNTAIWHDASGYIGLVARSTGPTQTFWMYDGTAVTLDGTPSVATNTWYRTYFKWDGSNMKIRRGTSAWDSKAAGNLALLTMQFRFCRGYAFSGNFFDGRLADISLNKTSIPSDATLDKIDSYLKSLYGL